MALLQKSTHLMAHLGRERNMQITMMKQVPQELQDCLKECSKFTAVCRNTITRFLLMGASMFGRNTSGY